MMALHFNLPPGYRTLQLVFWTVILMFMSACSSEITDDDLKIWTNNEEGFRQMESIMVNPEVSHDTRVKGLYFLAKANQSPQVSRILYATPAPEKLAQGLRDKLLAEMTPENPDAVLAKDSLFSLAGFLPAKEKAEVLAKIAGWAFDGLSMDSPTEKLKQQVEHRIGINGVERLEEHGVEGAALLISRGFAVSTLFDYISSHVKTADKDKILDALIAYGELPEISLTRNQLSRFFDLGTPRAGAHLMGLYLSLGTEDKDLGLDAFNGAQEIFSKEENRKNPEVIAKSIEPLLGATKDPDDRWYAATMLLQLRGVDALETCVEALKDDGIYTNGMIDPLKSIVDFCRDGVVPLKEAGVEAASKMIKSKNPVHQTVGLICMKDMEIPLPKKRAKKLSKSKRDLNFLLGNKMTLGRLVQNLQDTIDYLKKEKEAAGEDKDKVAAYESKKFFAIVTVDKVGEALVGEIENRHKDSVGEEK